MIKRMTFVKHRADHKTKEHEYMKGMYRVDGVMSGVGGRQESIWSERNQNKFV